MIFSLKEAKQKAERELEENWVTEVVNFVKLIVLGIDSAFVVKRGEGYSNTIQIGLPVDNPQKPFNVVVGIVFHDDFKNSVLFDLSWDNPVKGKFIIPLQKEEFVKEMKKVLQTSVVSS
jgi:hypothetical protein